jgi:hypothetical protein
MLGWTGQGFEQDIAKRIWDRNLKVTYADLEEGELGEYTIGSGGITISKTLLGGGKEGSAKLAAVMSHEGTHVNGNRIEGLAHLQGYSTYEMIKSMFGLQGDAEFSAGIAGAIFDRESWAANTGNTDYWRVRKDEFGRVVQVLDDGDREHATIVDAEGNIEKIVDIDASSLTGQLAAAIGNGMSATDINQIMMDSGLWWTKESGWYAREEHGIYVEPEVSAVAEINEIDKTNWFDNAWSGIKDGFTTVKNGILNWLGITKPAVNNEMVPQKTEEVKPSYLNKDEFNQEMLEDAYGLNAYSACFLTATAWLNSVYQLQNGNPMTPDAIVGLLSGGLDKVYDAEGTVLDLNLIGTYMAGKNGLVFAGDFTSLDEMKEAGYNYYLEVRTRNDGVRAGIHAIGWSNGVRFDPYNTTEDNWWDFDEKSRVLKYRAFGVREVKK